jgi:uncharacterized protein
MGCSTLPETIEGCSKLPEIYSTAAEITACEEAVLKREDHRFKKALEEAQHESKSQSCYQAGGVWDQRSNKCKPWSML